MDDNIFIEELEKVSKIALGDKFYLKSYLCAKGSIRFNLSLTITCVNTNHFDVILTIEFDDSGDEYDIVEYAFDGKLKPLMDVWRGVLDPYFHTGYPQLRSNIFVEFTFAFHEDLDELKAGLYLYLFNFENLLNRV